MNKIKAWIIKKLGGYTEIPTARIVNEIPFVFHAQEKPIITLQGTFEIPDDTRTNDEIKAEIIKRNICESIAKEIYKAGAYEQKKCMTNVYSAIFIKLSCEC